MKKLYIIAIVLTFYACSEKKECSFTTIDQAVECACKISTEKLAAKGDASIISELKEQAKTWNTDFEKAIKDSIFTEQEFIERLKANCESFNL